MSVIGTGETKGFMMRNTIKIKEYSGINT